MDKITAPFTPEQVELLNRWQVSGFHPFTCCSTTSSGEPCNRSEHDDGVLVAREEGWVCPCGKYTQDWAHTFMLDKPISMEEHLSEMFKQDAQGEGWYHGEEFYGYNPSDDTHVEVMRDIRAALEMEFQVRTGKPVSEFTEYESFVEQIFNDWGEGRHDSMNPIKAVNSIIDKYTSL